MANPFTYCELHTTDPNAARGFYARLFDWKLEQLETPSGAYTTIDVGAGTGGGLMTQMAPGAPSAWQVYVAVEDVEKATQKAVALGARLQVPKTEVKGHGWFSVLADPTGATFALWENLQSK
jgi:predicted enzyme related to lactoylglutathione lyase